MVVPTFRTWVAGEVVTAAYMNANVRDGGNFFLARPLAELRQTVAQTLTTGVSAALLFDTEDLDTDNGHSTVTNTSRYTSPTAGWLHFSGGCGFASNVTNRRGLWWNLNGAVINGTDAVISCGGSNNVVSVTARAKHIQVNGSTDYVDLVAFQDSGGNLATTVGTTSQPSMTVRWLHT